MANGLVPFGILKLIVRQGHHKDIAIPVSLIEPTVGIDYILFIVSGGRPSRYLVLNTALVKDCANEERTPRVAGLPPNGGHLLLKVDIGKTLIVTPLLLYSHIGSSGGADTVAVITNQSIRRKDKSNPK